MVFTGNSGYEGVFQYENKILLWIYLDTSVAID